MSRLSRLLVIAVLGIALGPTAAHAQFVALPLGGFGNYGWPFFGGYPGYGGWPGFGGLGFGGYGMGGGYPYGYGGWPGYVSGPSYFSTSYMMPVVYTVSTPTSGYRRETPVTPEIRPTVWPAIPYRDAPTTDARPGSTCACRRRRRRCRSTACRCSRRVSTAATGRRRWRRARTRSTCACAGAILPARK